MMTLAPDGGHTQSNARQGDQNVSRVNERHNQVRPSLFYMVSDRVNCLNGVCGKTEYASAFLCHIQGNAINIGIHFVC